MTGNFRTILTRQPAVPLSCRVESPLCPSQSRLISKCPYCKVSYNRKCFNPNTGLMPLSSWILKQIQEQCASDSNCSAHNVYEHDHIISITNHLFDSITMIYVVNKRSTFINSLIVETIRFIYAHQYVNSFSRS